MGMKQGQQKKEGKKGEGRTKARQNLVKFGKWLFLFQTVGQYWLSVSTAAEKQQRRTEAVMRMQQEAQVKEYRRMEETSQGCRKLKGEDRRKDGGLQLTQQETPMKGQAVRIESIHQESLLQSTAINEQSWEQKKERLIRSQVSKEESPKHG